MRFRSLARHLVALTLAAAPAACAHSQKTDGDDIQDPPPPPEPSPILDASAYSYADGAWVKGENQILAGFPAELRITLRPVVEIDPGQSTPFGVLMSSFVAEQHARAPQTPADEALARVLQMGLWGDLVVRPLMVGFLVTIFERPNFCQDGQVTSIVVRDDAEPEIVDTQYLPMTDCQHPRGRRPPGLASRPAATDDALARFLAEAAHLEAASVPAFERLADELVEMDAPARLVAATRRAAADEVRHAAAMLALGAAPTAVELTPVPARDAVAIALDNAVEGCVHESFAAVLCAWQAAHAVDPAIARAMAPIADDECDHADLAVAIAAWLEPQLDPAARAAIDAAVASALDQLPARAAADAARVGTAAAPLGIPEPAIAAALARAFAAHVRRARA